MSLWKIALLSYAIVLAIGSFTAFVNIIRLSSLANAVSFFKGWRVYADTLFFTSIVLLSFNIALFTQSVWATVFLLAVFTAFSDQFIYPKEIQSEPYVDKAFLTNVRLRALGNIPIYTGLYIYAFSSPHIWN